MKRKLLAILTALCALCVCAVAVACSEPQPPVDYGTLTVDNITVVQGDSATLTPTFSKPEYFAPVTYTFDGSDIMIANGVVTGVNAGTTTTVTATTLHHTATFTVTVNVAPSLTLHAPEEIFLDYPAVPLSVVMGDPNDTREIVYTVDGAPEGLELTVKDGMISATGTMEGTSERVSALMWLTASTADGELSDEVTVKVTRYNGAGYNGGSLNMHVRAQNFVSEMEAYCGTQGGEKGGTLYIGDSFFDGFWPIGDFRSHYDGQNAYRWGVSSSTLADWLIFAERVVFPFEPKNVVIHCGTNDYYDDHKSADSIVAMSKQLFNSLHDRIDGVKVWYFGIEPRKTNTGGMQSYDVPLTVNAALKSYAEQNADWLTYIDSPAWCFTDASRSTINTAFYSDNVHPAHASYALYVDALRNAGMVTTPTTGVTTGAMLGFATTKDSTVASTTRALYHAGRVLTSEYLMTAKLRVDEVKLDSSNLPNNPHVEIGFSAGNRFLLWNNDKDTAFGFGWESMYAYYGETAESGIEKWVFNGTDALVIELKLLVTDRNAYLYVDGMLELVSYNVPNLSRGLMIGSENVGITLYDLACSKKDSDAYQQALEASEIRECGEVARTGNKLYTALTKRYVAGGMRDFGSLTWDDDFELVGGTNTVYTYRDWLFTVDGQSRFSGDLALTYDVTVVDHSFNPYTQLSQNSSNAFYVITASETTERGIWNNPHHLLYWKGSGANFARVTYHTSVEKASGLTALTFRATTVRKGNTLTYAVTVGETSYTHSVTLTEGSQLTLWLGGENWNFSIRNMTFTQQAAGVTSALAAIGITA